jgi:enoyl-CoA hydratase/carnithine racemase
MLVGRPWQPEAARPRSVWQDAGVYQDIIYDVDDPVATITLNRPDSLNAWTQRMAAEVRHAVYRAESDPAVVGIVVTGAGRAFCAGADMKNLQALSSGGDVDVVPEGLDVTPQEPLPPDFDGEYTWLLAVNKPVIAAINGAIAGMAVPIALCCDIRFMAADAPLLTAFSQRGLVAEWGIAWLLPRLVGTGHALDLLFSSRKITGEEAAAMGLVNRALPKEQVLSHSVDYVRDLALRVSPTSLSIMKRQVYQQLTASLGPSEREAVKLMVESFGRPDFKEGVASFVEKRPPNFRRLGSTAE